MGRTKGALGKKIKESKKIEVIDKNEILISSDETPINLNILKELTKEQKEKRNKLNSVLRDINKNIPGAEVQYADSLIPRERLSFGYKCLDKLTNGGIPRGTFTTIWGSKGSGKSSIAYKMIATAQKQGLIALYIDMERSYDAKWAVKFGVNVNELIYEKCDTAEQAMDTIIKLCKEKVIDFIVLDSIQGLSPKGEQIKGKSTEKSVEDDTMALLARKLSQFFRMSVGKVSDAQCAILLIGQARMDLGSFVKLETLSGGHALMHYSRLIIKFRRGQGVDAPIEKIETEEVDKNGKLVKEDKKVGFDMVAHIDKSQIDGCVEGDSIHVPFYYLKGVKE